MTSSDRPRCGGTLGKPRRARVWIGDACIGSEQCDGCPDCAPSEAKYTPEEHRALTVGEFPATPDTARLRELNESATSARQSFALAGKARRGDGEAN